MGKKTKDISKQVEEIALKGFKNKLEKPKVTIDHENRELTGTEKEEVMKILESPNLFELVKRELDKIHVGNDKIKVLLWILTFSRFRKDPFLIMIVDDSASGKSHLVKSVLKLFEKDIDYEVITTASQKSFYYFEDDWEDKILFLMEMEALDDESIPVLRCWYSEGSELGLKHRTVKEMKKLLLKLGKPPVGIITTTKRSIGEQLGTRAWRINVEKSLEQHERIRKFQVMKRLRGAVEIEINPAFQNISKSLDMKLPVIIPYVDFIKFPCMEKERINRDIPRFFDLIEIVTLLHQHQRDIVKINGKRHVISRLDDFYKVLEYAGDSFKITMTEMDKDAKQILKIFDGSSEFSTLDVVNNCPFQYDKVYQLLRQIQKTGIISSRKQGREKVWFRVKEDLKFDNICIKCPDGSLTVKDLEESLSGTFDNFKFERKVLENVLFSSENVLLLSEKDSSNVIKEELDDSIRLEDDQRCLKQTSSNLGEEIIIGRCYHCGEKFSERDAQIQETLGSGHWFHEKCLEEYKKGGLKYD